MTVRIASDHFYSVRFEELTGQWDVDPVFHTSMLRQPVEFLGAVTLANLVDLVRETPQLRHFVEGFFGIDLGELTAQAPDSVFDPDVVYSYACYEVADWNLVTLEPTLEIDFLEISRSALVRPELGDPKIGYSLLGNNRSSDSLAVRIHHSCFQAVQHFPIRIDRTLTITDGEDLFIEGQKAFTLLELLEATIGHFVEQRPRWSPSDIQVYDQVEFYLKRWVDEQIQQQCMPGQLEQLSLLGAPTKQINWSVPVFLPDDDDGDASGCLAFV